MLWKLHFQLGKLNHLACSLVLLLQSFLTSCHTLGACKGYRGVAHVTEQKEDVMLTFQLLHIMPYDYSDIFLHIYTWSVIVCAPVVIYPQLCVHVFVMSQLIFIYQKLQ